MPTASLTLDTIHLDSQSERIALYDQMNEAGLPEVLRTQAALREQGLLDDQGNVLVKELPPDMQPESERDFGG